MNDRSPQVEERLRAALRARSEEVEPSSGSYLRLQRRLAAEQGSDQRRRATVPPRYLAAAAVLLVAVASAAALVSQQRRSSVETIGTATTPTTVAEQSPSVTVAETVGEVKSPPSVPVREYVPAPVAGPRQATPEEAALAFLDLLDIDHAGLEIDGLTVGVRTHTEGREVGAVVVRLELIEAEIGKGTMGYSVISATSESITITSPASGSENTLSPLVVAGRGHGFEGSLGVSFVSSSDGSVLASTATAAGNLGEMDPFTAELAVNGAERGWIVVASVGAADNVLPPFSAIPISFVVGMDPVEYVVANVPADDPDGGLHLRDLPGVDDGRVLITLPTGTPGIRRLGRVPAIVGEETWWEVVVDMGGRTHRGWVNRRYLADPAAPEPSDESTEPVTEEELAAMAKRFLLAGVDRDLPSLRQLPWAEQVEIGWIRDPGPFSRELLASDDFWAGSHRWAMPGELGEPEVTLSLLSLLELPTPTDPDIAFEVDADPVSPYALDQAALDARFPEARTVTIFDTTPETPWRHTTLVVEQTVDGPRIIAVLLTVWLP